MTATDHRAPTPLTDHAFRNPPPRGYGGLDDCWTCGAFGSLRPCRLTFTDSAGASTSHASCSCKRCWKRFERSGELTPVEGACVPTHVAV